jgi:hypothetical protein
MALPSDAERHVAGGIVRVSSATPAGLLYTALDTLIH